MALFRLLASLGLDNSQFKSGMAESEARANIFAQRFQRSFKSTITKGVTFGFAVQMVRSAFADAEKLQGVSEKTRESMIQMRTAWGVFSDAFKSTIGELSTLGLKFADMIDSIFGTDPKNSFRATFGIGTLGQSPEEAAEGIAALERKLKLAETEKQKKQELFDLIDANNLKEMTAEEKKLELTRRRAAILELLERGAPKSKVLEMLTDAEQLRGQINDIKLKVDKDKPDRFKTINFGQGSHDPLAKIGGFTGGADVKVLSIQERIARATEETADNTGKNGVSFR